MIFSLTVQKYRDVLSIQLSNRSVLHNSYSLIPNLTTCLMHSLLQKEKLQSKGVASVRQRVTNVAIYTQLDILAFMDYVRQEMCGTEVLKLTEEDMKEVAEIEKELSSDDFVYGKNPKYSLVQKAHRFEGVGTLEAHIELKNNIIGSINMVGDYFLLGDIDHDFLSLLKGCEFWRGGREIGKHRSIHYYPWFEAATVPRLLFGREPHVMKPAWLKIDLTSKSRLVRRLASLPEASYEYYLYEWTLPKPLGMLDGSYGNADDWRYCLYSKVSFLQRTLSGRPKLLNPDDEPRRVAESVKALKLRYAVITSVDRDDLPDYVVQLIG